MADAFVAVAVFLFVKCKGDKCSLVENFGGGGEGVQLCCRMPQLDVGDTKWV